MSETSTKPYLLRAIYEWCTDNGYTPYLAVMVDARARVPMQFVKNGEIVLNISFDATSGLRMDNDFIHFNARFGGVARDIVIPVDNVIAIYARENGQGMAFDVAKPPADEIKELEDQIDGAAARSEPASLTPVPAPASDKAEGATPDGNDEPPKKGSRPTLTRIK